MAKEIERKFLVSPDKLSLPPKGKRIVQGYIKTENGTTVRVRIKGEEAFLTLKGKTVGISRTEYEYNIPLSDAELMLQEFCAGVSVEKTRYEINVDSHLWEVDIFHDNNEGLLLAEVELQSEDEFFTIPDWITTEVSGDKRYFNSYLLEHPFREWTN